MRGSKWIAAGVLVILVGVMSCSNNNNSIPTAPKQNSTSSQTGIENQITGVVFEWPNPVVGTLGTAPEGCRIVNVDNLHYVVLNLDNVTPPFELVDGMSVLVRGGYIRFNDTGCPGIVFVATSMALPGAGKTTQPTNSFNDQ